MKTLKELLQNTKTIEVSGNLNIPIEGLTIDSRKAESNYIFFALQGVCSDGHSFINTAIENGACVIVHSADIPKQQNVTYIKVTDCSIACGEMSAAFYDYPSQKMKVVGITGTNGKTTTATLLYRMFNNMGYKSGLISTISYEFPGFSENATHTTPDAIRLNKIFAQMLAHGCQYVFMEVSSHAVVQKRIAGIDFEGGVFSNITQDHLDFHKTFSEYIAAKKAFFDHLPTHAFALTNSDDPNGNVMVQNTKAKVYQYSLNRPTDFKGKIIENSIHGLHLDLDNIQAWFRLMGRFNAYNLTAVYACAVLLGMEKENVLKHLSALETVNGRFDIVRSNEGVTAVIDYAHTPDALKKILETLRETGNTTTKIICVAGAGGDRDKSKRPIMGKVMASLSDFAIITSDNPRSEDPIQIAEDMSSEIDPVRLKKVLKILDRKEAIKTALAMASSGDIILIAGKGHETYQEIQGVRYHFNDKEIVQNLFNQ